MITEELKDLVIKEATNLKIHATAGELEKLDITFLNAFFPEDCIYGQMTGSCWNKRAEKLITLCAAPVSFQNLISPRSLNEKARCKNENLSPLEFFIAQANKDQNQKLVAFLKGETDTLIL